MPQLLLTIGDPQLNAGTFIRYPSIKDEEEDIASEDVVLIQGEAEARFTREVLERTGGRISITNQYDASSGFRSKEMLDVTMPTCVPNAPFGRPVVPEVYMMNAVSSSSTTTAGGRSRVSVRRSSGSVPAGGRPAT